MRYRRLDVNGDYSFGHGQAEFYINNREAVGQLILTRLKLIEGEWFLDVTEGTPYFEQILGKGTTPIYDAAIRSRILGTQGVTSITKYDSHAENRRLTVEASVDTIFGAVQVSTIL